MTDMAKSYDSTKMHYEMLLEQELRMQREEEKYTLFIGILSKEEEVTQRLILMITLIHILSKRNQNID